MSRRLQLTMLIALLVGLVGTGTAVTWFDDPLEYKVKAGCLSNFARFVTFPDKAFASKTAPLIVGVVGEDPFGKILDANVDGKQRNGRTVKVVRKDTLDELLKTGPLHMLFIAESEHKQIDKLLAKLDKAPVFIVSEAAGFATRGGVCRLFVDRRGRIAFDINLDEANRRGLTLSSHLLKLATVVRDPAKKVGS